MEEMEIQSVVELINDRDQERHYLENVEMFLDKGVYTFWKNSEDNYKKMDIWIEVCDNGFLVRGKMGYAKLYENLEEAQDRVEEMIRLSLGLEELYNEIWTRMMIEEIE